MLCAVTTALAVPASATSLPSQGMYEACYPGVTPTECTARLQQLGTAGFRVVLNYWMLYQSSAQQVLDYAQAAENSGLQVVWPLNDFWAQSPSGTGMLTSMPSLATTCGCSDNRGMVAYIVSLARGRANTWGYYLADEPSASQKSQLQSFNQSVKADDPNHPGLIVVCGVCAGGDPTGSQAAPFNDLSVTLGTDLYPVSSQAPDSTYAYNYVAAGMQGLQNVANSGGLQSAVVLQSWNWGDGPYPQFCGGNTANCRFPTEQEMWMERNAAVLNGSPRLILWFGLFDVLGWPSGKASDWSQPSNPIERWNDLIQAAFDPNATAPASNTVLPPSASSSTLPASSCCTPLPSKLLSSKQPNPRITRMVISRHKHSATFWFKAVGSTPGFRCALVKQPKNHKRLTPRFFSCRSPKTYKHLRRGKYKFYVRVGRYTPATKGFTL